MDLQVFFQAIGNLVEPSLADPDLYQKLHQRSRCSISRGLPKLWHSITQEMLDLILQNLNCQDVGSFRIATGLEPSSLGWIRLALRTFGAPLNDDISIGMKKKMLRNLPVLPRKNIPHTMNYLIVLENVDMVLEKMRKTPHGSPYNRQATSETPLLLPPYGDLKSFQVPKFSNVDSELALHYFNY